MGRVIAIANQKGGVGKTTTAINLSAALSAAEKKTLLIDSDPQGSATRGLGLKRDPGRPTLYDALSSGHPLDDVCMPTGLKFLFVAPSSKDLVGLEIELLGVEEKEYRLKRSVDRIRDRFDYVYIDCPPSLGILTLNSLAAADGVLIPVQCEYMALEGVSDLMDTLKRVKKGINPALRIEGVLLTMYDERTNLSKQVASEIRKYFTHLVYGTQIPRNVRIGEAPSFGKPVLLYDVTSKGAVSYLNLAREVLEHDEKGSWQRAGGAAS